MDKKTGRQGTEHVAKKKGKRGSRDQFAYARLHINFRFLKLQTLKDEKRIFEA